MGRLPFGVWAEIRSSWSARSRAAQTLRSARRYASRGGYKGKYLSEAHGVMRIETG